MDTTDFIQLQKIIPEVKIIIQSNYRFIAYSSNESLLYHEWLEEGTDIDDDIFRSESLLLFEVLQKYRPTFFLVNDKKRKLSISKEINEFLVVNFQPIYAHSSMKKVALISNEMLSIQSQAESTMEDVNNSKVPSEAVFNFFIDITQAIEWLREK